MLDFFKVWLFNCKFIYLLKRITSCLKTVFIDSSYTTGYLSTIICMSKSGRSFDRMSSASSSTDSCKRIRQHTLVCNLSSGLKLSQAKMLPMTDSTNLRWLSPASHLPGQSEQYSIQELIGLLVVLSNISIAVEPEHTGIGTNRKTTNVINVSLELRKSGKLSSSSMRRFKISFIFCEIFVLCVYFYFCNI